MCCFVCVWLCICIHQFLCTIWWVLTNAYSGIITTTTMSIEVTSIPPNVSYCTFCEMSSSFPPSTGVWQILTFFTLFKISYKWNHAACSICFCFFFHPLSMNTFEIHPCNCSSQYFLCIYCQIVFLCMDVLWYFYSLSRLQNCELYSSFSYYEESHCEYLNISLHKFI